MRSKHIPVTDPDIAWLQKGVICNEALQLGTKSAGNAVRGAEPAPKEGSSSAH